MPRRNWDLLLGELGLKAGQARELQSLPMARLLEANAAVQKKITLREPGGSANSPMVDGKVIPGHPWDPKGPALSANVPLLIGYARTEETLYDRRNGAPMNANHFTLFGEERKVPANRRHGDIELLRQLFHRLAKAQPFGLHQPFEAIAALAAAEAFVEPALILDLDLAKAEAMMKPLLAAPSGSLSIRDRLRAFAEAENLPL